MVDGSWIADVLLPIDPGLDLVRSVGLVPHYLGQVERLTPDFEELAEGEDPCCLRRFDVDSARTIVSIVSVEPVKAITWPNAGIGGNRDLLSLDVNTHISVNVLGEMLVLVALDLI